MGANFQYVTCPRFRPTDARLRQLKDLVLTVPTAIQDEVAESLGCDPEDATDGLVRAIDELDGIDNRRDVSTIVCSHLTCWITGGMSYGDAPTEAFATLAWVKAAEPLAHQIEIWAIEDALNS